MCAVSCSSRNPCITCSTPCAAIALILTFNITPMVIYQLGLHPLNLPLSLYQCFTDTQGVPQSPFSVHFLPFSLLRSSLIRGFGSSRHMIPQFPAATDLAVSESQVNQCLFQYIHITIHFVLEKKNIQSKKSKSEYNYYNAVLMLVFNIT